MAYPPPNPGYPGYPPPSGGVGGGYSPQQSSPWVPGGAPAPYPSQPIMPAPGGGGGGAGLGFGSGPTPGYPPPQSSSSSYQPYPSSQPPPSTYPPPPSSSTYPPPPSSSTYPPPPSSSTYPYPPPPSSSTYPPPPSSSTYPPPPSSSTYPPAPSHYPTGPPPAPFTVPSSHGVGGYPPGPTPGTGGFTPQPTPSGGFTPQHGGFTPQPTLGGYSQYSTPQAPPSGGYPSQPPAPFPSQTTPPAASHLSSPPTEQMGAMSVSSSQQRSTTSSTQPSSSSSSSASSSSSSSATASKKVPTRGTVKPHSPFSAEDDAKKLRTSMKGLGTDEKAIISVLAYRSNQQRQDIKLKFKASFGRDLISDLKSELSGNFEELVLGLMMTPSEYDADAVYNAIKGLGTDESTLIEILCTRSNDEILALKKQYKTVYGRDVEKAVASDTSGHFKRLLISLLTGARERDGSVDQERARADAQALYKAGEARWGTDESMFNQVLASRSFSHLKVVFQEYSKICKYDIEQSISREMSGDLKACMITVVKCVRDKCGYFAERLYKSMKGLGTDDRTLVRVMVTRCEVDMEDIKDKFYQKYRKTLGSFIKGDTSGDYRRILMALARADD